MTLKGVMTVILRYFTEFVYDVVVEQLRRFFGDWNLSEPTLQISFMHDIGSLIEIAE